MDEQMIAAMVVAVKGELIGCCKSQTADGRGTDWDELARAAVGAAHSVIAGKVAELEAENARLSDAVCSGVLGALLTPDENAALVAFVKELRRAALAPYPERRSE